MSSPQLESAIQNSRLPRPTSLWNNREFPEIVASEKTFGQDITVVDCWLGGSEPDPNVHDIQESKIEGWLKITPPRSDSGQEPSAGLRIIHRGQWDAKISPFSPHVTEAIDCSFKLPESISDSAIGLSGACVRLGFESSQVFVCQRGKSAWSTTVVIRYDSKTNITQGYVYSARPLEIRGDLQRIPSEFAKLPHPLLLPLLMHELALENVARNMDRLDVELQGIEAQSGFSDYDRKITSRKKDYRPQIDSLGSVTHRFAYDQFRLRSVELTNQFLRQQVSSIDVWLTDDQHRAKLEIFTVRLQERLDLAWSSIQHLQQYRGLEKRMQVQQDVLFNLIAQQDSTANMDILAATQRDGAGMKIIAVLTALFLPGTFVAAFFAMSMFDWQASDGSQIVSRWFWVYWAITAPLTVISALIMRWVMVQGRRERVESRATGDVEAGQASKASTINEKRD